MRLCFRLGWCLWLMTICNGISAQDLGIFTDTWDDINGKTEYNAQLQQYTLSASKLGGSVDSYIGSHMVYRVVEGDFIIRAHLKYDENPGAIGLVAKEQAKTEAPGIYAVCRSDGEAELMHWNGKYGSSLYLDGSTATQIIQLERKGNQWIVSAASQGRPFAITQINNLELGDRILVGLFVGAEDLNRKKAATFYNVRLIKPPKPEHVPYQDYLGSHIEVMNVESAHRKVVHTAPNSLQAPNWMLDDHVFTYNADGFLYDFDLRTGVSTKINTDFADRNNNDHVHSFDGTRMGISHAPEDEGHSIIYTIPRNGGTPQRVTPLGPSYLHGWSPDGRYLVYTGRRGEAWDLYRIPAEGGEEERLTDAPGLDDGSEYSPDGQYIYFNSNRTGTMQIWRMKADGSEQEQLTFDEFQDWFPHISPDGQWMVFISYLPEVPSGSHPFYKQVYIRLMPVSGGDPRVIAYVYGGQGTMNVPNWSPDSKRIAFVSNSDFLNFSKKP